MADQINTGQYAGESSGPRELHPAETVLMRCVDVVSLGVRPETYLGQDKGTKPKCALVFQSSEKRTDGSHFELSREFTVSTGGKAALRAFLESWRGAKYEEEYPDVPLHKMAGVWAMVSVIHKKSADGTKTYANIAAITPVPKVLKASLPELPAYTRADFWAERIAKYAAEAAAYRASHAAPPEELPPAPPEALVGEDDESWPF
jgi:hypothetical protein